MAVKRLREAVDEAHPPKRARGEAPGLPLRRCASTTRRRMCSTAPAADPGGAGAVLDEFAEGR